ncbi:MAG: hypothetical protein HC831_19930 [Chloroflexia bacterium]|nr:hypothetical protein [Chloroflexia bacterium]
MRSTFESLMGEVIPEINFLTASGAGIKPGTVLESLEKDIVIGYLPDFIKDLPSMKGRSFETIREAYDLKVHEIDGFASSEGAFQLMDLFGMKYDRTLNYKINFDIAEISSVKFAQNLEKINFEIALEEFRQTNRDVFRRFKGHILVLRVLYANKYEITVDIEKDGKYQADVDFKNVELNPSMKYEKKENTLIVSNNSDVPFGVVGYKIKGNKLKEID